MLARSFRSLSLTLGPFSGFLSVSIVLHNKFGSGMANFQSFSCPIDSEAI